MDIASLSHGLIEVTTWQDRLLQCLERIYASPKMYQWSLGNPFTRWITTVSYTHLTLPTILRV